MSRVRILPGALFDTRHDLVFMLVVAGFSFFERISVLVCFGLFWSPMQSKCSHKIVSGGSGSCGRFDKSFPTDTADFLLESPGRPSAPGTWVNAKWPPSRTP